MVQCPPPGSAEFQLRNEWWKHGRDVPGGTFFILMMRSWSSAFPGVSPITLRRDRSDECVSAYFPIAKMCVWVVT